MNAAKPGLIANGLIPNGPLASRTMLQLDGRQPPRQNISAQGQPEELAESPELPNPSCLPSRIPWGKFGPVTITFDRERFRARRFSVGLTGRLPHQVMPR